MSLTIISVVIVLIINVIYAFRIRNREELNSLKKVILVSLQSFLACVYILMFFFGLFGVLNVNMIVYLNLIYFPVSWLITHLRNKIYTPEERYYDPGVVRSMPVKVLVSFTILSIVFRMFRYVSNEYEIIIGIISIIIFLGLIYFYIRLRKSSKGSKVRSIHKYFSLSVLFFAVTLPLFRIVDFSNLDIFINDKGQYQTKSIFSNYYSTNLLEIEDGAINHELLDFYVEDNLVYYMIGSNQKYYLKVYDYVNKTYVLESVLPTPEKTYISKFDTQGDIGVFYKIEGKLYCFLPDGIYYFEGLSLIRISDIELDNSYHFYHNGNLHVLEKVKDSDDKIYKLTSSLEYVEDIKDSPYYIVNNQLVVKDSINKQFTLYKGPSFNEVDDIRFLDILIVTENHIVYSDKEPYSYTDVYIVDLEGNVEKKRSTILFSPWDHFTKYKGLYFSEGQQVNSMSLNKGMFDEDLNLVKTYDLKYINPQTHKYMKDEEHTVSIQDDRFYYATYRHRYRGSDELHIEINELIEYERNFFQYYYNYLGVYTVPFISLIFLIPLDITEEEKQKSAKKLAERRRYSFNYYTPLDPLQTKKDKTESNSEDSQDSLI